MKAILTPLSMYTVENQIWAPDHSLPSPGLVYITCVYKMTQLIVFHQ